MWAEVSTIVLDSLLQPLRLPSFDYAIVYHDPAAKVCERENFVIQFMLIISFIIIIIRWWIDTQQRTWITLSPQSILLHARLIWWRWCAMLKLRIEETMWHAIIPNALLSTTVLILGAFNAETMRRVGWCDFPRYTAYSHKNESNSLRVREN